MAPKSDSLSGAQKSLADSIGWKEPESLLSGSSHQIPYNETSRKGHNPSDRDPFESLGGVLPGRHLKSFSLLNNLIFQAFYLLLSGSDLLSKPFGDYVLFLDLPLQLLDDKRFGYISNKESLHNPPGSPVLKPHSSPLSLHFEAIAFRISPIVLRFENNNFRVRRKKCQGRCL